MTHAASKTPKPSQVVPDKCTQSQLTLAGQASGRTEVAPPGENGGMVELEIPSPAEGAPEVEMFVHRALEGGKFLQASHPPEPQHAF